jgi:hypothetical protein
MSCGCGTKEATSAAKTKHSRCDTPTYRSWAMMKTRVKNANGKDFKDYGGRGISLAPRWELFVNFLADMGERPAGTSIDRIDVNGNYEPGNCRWATATEQGRNARGLKLSPEKVVKARELRTAGASWAKIAAQYGCSAGTVRLAVLGITWVGV